LYPLRVWRRFQVTGQKQSLKEAATRREKLAVCWGEGNEELKQLRITSAYKVQRGDQPPSRTGCMADVCLW
jgi:hypothetical protein